MDLVTAENKEMYENLTKTKGKLNISKNSPLHVKFGTIIDSADQLAED